MSRASDSPPTTTKRETPSWDRSDDRHGEWPRDIEQVVLLRDGEVWDSQGGRDCEGQSIAYEPSETLAYGSPLGQVLQAKGYLPNREKVAT